MVPLKTVNLFASELAKFPLLYLDDDICAQYGIYTNVPISELCLYDKPVGIKPSEVGPAYLTVDMVITSGSCTRVMSDVYLAVMFGDDWRVQAWFGPSGVLSGLPYVHFSSEDMKDPDAVCEVICSKLNGLSHSAYTIDVSRIDYALPEGVIPNLTECGMIAEDGTVTPLGCQYGLFGGYNCNTQVYEYFLSETSSGKILESIIGPPEAPVGPRGASALQTQLKRVNTGLPTNDAFVNETVAQAKRLLQLPLTEHFRAQPDLYGHLRKLVAEIQADWLPDASAPQTFGDALCMSQTLYNRYLYPKCTHARYQGMVTLNSELLNLLCRPVVCSAQSGKSADRQSLAFRLGGVSESLPPVYHVFEIPMTLYIYSACILRRSYRPDWIFRNRLSPCIPALPDVIDKDACRVLDFIKCALHDTIYPNSSLYAYERSSQLYCTS